MADDTGSELSPAPLMWLTAGFWSFKAFAAAVELGLFTKLADGRMVTRREAAAELSIAERPADMFLASCASLGLLEMEGERYRNSALAEEFLVEGRPRYFGGFVRLCDQRGYLAWHDVIRALRTDQPLTWDPKAQDSLFASEDPLMLELFWEAMHSLSQFTAKRLGELYDFTSHRRLLDVGGGSGAFLIELCRRYAHLSGTVFDLERICPIAEKKILEAGLEEVIDTHAGDFRTDECLPGGYDVILLSSILHDWDEATGRSLLRKCWQALEPGGVLLICELLLNPERSGPPTAALMGLNMIVQTVGGRNYSESEYLEWLAQAGFAAPHLIRFEAAGANGAVVAHKH